MKYFKFLIVALLVATCLNTYGQANRGTYGTQSGYTAIPMHIMNAQGVTKLSGKDTLVAGDTGYAYIWVGQGFNLSFDFITATITSTVTTTSNVLFGVNNNGVPLTPAQILTAAKYAITGNTTYCSTCVGASSTTVPGVATHYVWQVPVNAGAQFDNYIIRTIQTGTATATYSSKVVTQY